MIQTKPRQLASDFQPYARAVAVRMARHLRCWPDLDEMTADAFYGLVLAAEGFDPGDGHSFATYARKFVRGEILKGVRRRQPGCVSIDQASSPRLAGEIAAATSAEWPGFREVDLQDQARVITEMVCGSSPLRPLDLVHALGISRALASLRIKRARRLVRLTLT